MVTNTFLSWSYSWFEKKVFICSQFSYTALSSSKSLLEHIGEGTSGCISGV